jgi:RNA polymerase sigma factor for flagellar operon FliA
MIALAPQLPAVQRHDAAIMDNNLDELFAEGLRPGTVAQPINRHELEEANKVVDPEHDGTWERFRSMPHCYAERLRLHYRLTEFYDWIPRKIAKRYSHRNMPYASLHNDNDLLQDARVGLVEAIKEFIPGTVKFETFATWRVKGAMYDGLRAMQNFTRKISRQRRAIAPIVQQMTHELCRAPTPDEMAERHPYKQVGDDYLRNFVHDTLLYSQVFNQKGDGDVVGGTQESFTFDAQLAKHNRNLPYSVEARLCRHELISKVNRILDGDPDAQKVIFCYYFFNMTSSKISESTRLSQTWVSEVKIRALNKLRAYASQNEDFVDLLLSLGTQA